MFKNHFKFAIRNILREKYFSFINVIGLSVGIAVCLLIWSYVRFETQFDLQHPDVDRMYRVDQTNIWGDGDMMGSTGPNLGLIIQEDYPEIENVVRINTPGGFLVRYQQPGGAIDAYNETKVLAADSTFFEFFAFKLKEGDPNTALKGVDKVVISDETAKKFFGDKPAVGQILQFGEDKRAVVVSGVTEKQADNVHFQFDYLLSMYTNDAIKQNDWSWIWTQVVTYVKVKPGTDIPQLVTKMQSMATRRAKPSFARLGIDFDEFVKEKNGWGFNLKPVTDIHLKSTDEGNRIGDVGDIKYIQIFSVVAFFVLLIAVINFINLSTARGASRAKEVGVKKALGALRKSLIIQFQVESILMAACATLFGLALYELLRLTIAGLLTMPLMFSIWDEGVMMWLLPLLPIVIGGLAGVYPALYLTAFRPAQVLKGKLASGFKRSVLRNTLVVVQFTISIVFIVATVIVYQQLDYFSNFNLGFDKENMLVIRNAEKLGDHLESFRNELASAPGVTSAGVAMSVPGTGGYEDIFVKEGDQQKVTMSQNKIDEYFFTTMGFTLASGRSFDEKNPADVNGVILNETAAQSFNWTPEEAIGKRIGYFEFENLEVIGVVKDFNFQSLRISIAPAVFLHVRSKMWGDNRVLAVKFKSNEAAKAIRSIEEKWNKVVDNTPFEYSFLDDDWAKQYEQEQRMGGLFGMFAGFSILIAMIGLVGLVTYSAEQRRKEIGVRKVLGASVQQVVLLINRDFTLLVLLSFVIALPLGWYVIKDWQSQFAYPVPLRITSFLLAGLVMLVITWVTVAYQSIKAGMTNPVEVLKEE